MCLSVVLKPRGENILKNSRRKTTFHIRETNIMMNGHLIMRHSRGQKTVEGHTPNAKRKMAPEGSMVMSEGRKERLNM